MRIALFSFIFFLSASCLAADAPDFSALKRTGTGKVHRIIDGLTLLLKDEKIIRLSSLDLPGAPGDPENLHALAAKEALEAALPEGTDILIYQTRKAKIGRENRMGHQLAHIVTKDGETWINGMLVEKGLARAYANESNPEMAAELLALEDKAIKTKAGLWAEGGAPALSPDESEQALGHIAVIEGRVYNAASVRGNLYLNFGKDWKKDFTVMVSPSTRTDLAHKGINAAGLAHQTIRVRGFVRSYNGPFLELSHPHHLQVIEDAPAPLQQEAEIPTINPNP